MMTPGIPRRGTRQRPAGLRTNHLQKTILARGRPALAARALKHALESGLRRCEAAYARFSLWGQLAYQRPEALLEASRAGVLAHPALRDFAEIARGLS